MSRAKAFFYVCAGAFLLMLAFEMGASSASGQVGGAGWFLSGVPGGTPEIITNSGDQWRYVPGAGWLNDLPNVFGGAGGREVVAALPGHVVTSTGEVWYQGGHNPWTNAGAPPFGPTPVTSSSWGQVKARYR